MARKDLNHGALLEQGQGMLLLPTDAPDIGALLLAPAVEGGFFQDAELAERVKRLTYEGKALKNFASNCEAEGSIVDASNKIEGLEDFEDDVLPYIFRRHVSIATRERLAVLVPKINFAYSIGIIPETRGSIDPLTGKLIPKTLRAEAKDYNDRADLNRQYRGFRLLYAGIRNAKRRDARRIEVQQEIQAAQLGTVALLSN